MRLEKLKGGQEDSSGQKCEGEWHLMRLDGKGLEDVALQMRRDGHPRLSSCGNGERALSRENGHQLW